MADDTPSDLLNNPDFQKLSPEAQHIVLSKKFPAYANLSLEAQKVVLSKSIIPNANAQAAAQLKSIIPDQSTDADEVKRLVESGASPSAALMQPKQTAIAVGGMAAPELVPEGLGGAGLLAAATRILLRSGASGIGAGTGKMATEAASGENPFSATNLSETGKVALEQAGPTAVGSTMAELAHPVSKAAGPALARVLRLTPKSVQFGKEPAQEVLERGLATGTLPGIKNSIQEASKQVTSDLNDVLKATKGTVNVENHAIDVANNMPGNSSARFLKVVDDAAEKLGIRTNQLSSLTPMQVNALKQEIARQSKFVEGDVRPSVANAGRVFGGRLKGELIKLNPQVEPLLESSANLTEASKGADYAVRAEKVGQGKGLLGGVQLNKPGTYVRAITDRPSAPQLLYNIANSLKDHTPLSNALRVAINLAYGNPEGEQP